MEEHQQHPTICVFYMREPPGPVNIASPAAHIRNVWNGWTGDVKSGGQDMGHFACAPTNNPRNLNRETRELSVTGRLRRPIECVRVRENVRSRVSRKSSKGIRNVSMGLSREGGVGNGMNGGQLRSI